MAHRGLGEFHVRNGDHLRGAEHLALSAEQSSSQFGPQSTWQFEIRVEELSALVKADARERAIALLAVILDDLQVSIGAGQPPKEPFATALRDLARELGQSAALEAIFPVAPK